jgi:trigger factor
MSTRELDTDDAESTEEIDEAGDSDSSEKRKLDLGVVITDAGPCKKHLKISIPRSEVDRQFDESVNTLRKDAAVPGFRPGHAPRQLVIKRFKKQVSDQVKSSLLMAALEQIDSDYELDPITQPRLDLEAILLPEQGPLDFEMDIEVRPEFAVPPLDGRKVVRPVAEITDEDVSRQLAYFLEGRGRIVPKLEGAAEPGDYVTADLTFVGPDGTELDVLREKEFRLQPEVRFQNGTMPEIGETLKGIKPGETREVKALLGSAIDDPALRGATITVKVKALDLKKLRLPELTPEFLASLGFDSEDTVRAAVRGGLERKIASEQRQSMHAQIVESLLSETPFDLPSDLVSREEKNTIARLVSQLKHDGMTDTDIRARSAQIRANAHETTLRTLKEFLLLAKIAEDEGIEVKEEDIAQEIEQIAGRTDESVRRVRARIEKEGGADSLANQILERKVIDRILSTAQVEEQKVEITRPTAAVETLDYTLVHAAPADTSEPGTAATVGDGDKS